jgi:hypothetical protein
MKVSRKQQLPYDLGYAYFKSKNSIRLLLISNNIWRIRNLSLKMMQNFVWQIFIMRIMIWMKRLPSMIKMQMLQIILYTKKQWL